MAGIRADIDLSVNTQGVKKEVLIKQLMKSIKLLIKLVAKI